jgi:DNA polymerase-1
MIRLISNQSLIEGTVPDIESCSLEKMFEDISHVSVVGVDTETTGFDPFKNRLLTLQIGNRDVQYVIDFEAIRNRENVLDKLREFFKNTLCIFHNAKFDLRFLYVHGIYPENVYCTYLGEAIIHQGLPPVKGRDSLQGVAMKYLGIHLNKDVRGDIHWKGLVPEVIRYAAKDVEHLQDIMIAQQSIHDELVLGRTMTLENRFVRVLAYIENCGMRLDLPRWEGKCTEDEKVLQMLQKQLDDAIRQDPDLSQKYMDKQLDLFGGEQSVLINWSSPTQCVKFFKELGLDLSMKDKQTGAMKDSVDAKVLLPQKDRHPIIPLYLDFKGQEKTVSTYGRNWTQQVHPVTGRLHTTFRQLLNTGRLSSGGKQGHGRNQVQLINFLNIPQDNNLRNCIIPDKGKLFVDADYSGQESVVLANQSMEPKLISFYNKDGGDLHSFVAFLLYPECKDVPLDEIKVKFKQQRQNAKACNFAIAYGGVGATIAMNLSIPIEQGDEVYNAYLNAFPSLKKYFRVKQKEVLENGYVITDPVSQRKIFFPQHEEYLELRKELDEAFWADYREEKAKNSRLYLQVMKPKIRRFFQIKGEMERAALNFPIQGASASITKLACIYVFKEIESKGLIGKILFTNVIHDQILLEVPENMSDEWAQTVKDCMERAGDLFCKSVRLKAEPEILERWKK